VVLLSYDSPPYEKYGGVLRVKILRKLKEKPDHYMVKVLEWKPNSRKVVGIGWLGDRQGLAP